MSWAPHYNVGRPYPETMYAALHGVLQLHPWWNPATTVAARRPRLAGRLPGPYACVHGVNRPLMLTAARGGESQARERSQVLADKGGYPQ